MWPLSPVDLLSTPPPPVFKLKPKGGTPIQRTRAFLAFERAKSLASGASPTDSSPTSSFVHTPSPPSVFVPLAAQHIEKQARLPSSDPSTTARPTIARRLRLASSSSSSSKEVLPNARPAKPTNHTRHSPPPALVLLSSFLHNLESSADEDSEVLGDPADVARALAALRSAENLLALEGDQRGAWEAIACQQQPVLSLAGGLFSPRSQLHHPGPTAIAPPRRLPFLTSYLAARSLPYPFSSPPTPSSSLFFAPSPLASPLETPLARQHRIDALRALLPSTSSHASPRLGLEPPLNIHPSSSRTTSLACSTNASSSSAYSTPGLLSSSSAFEHDPLSPTSTSSSSDESSSSSSDDPELATPSSASPIRLLTALPGQDQLDPHTVAAAAKRDRRRAVLLLDGQGGWSGPPVEEEAASSEEIGMIEEDEEYESEEEDDDDDDKHSPLMLAVILELRQALEVLRKHQSP